MSSRPFPITNVRRASIPPILRRGMSLARVALDAGRTADAKTAFEQAASKAKDSNNPYRHFWAMLGLGDVAKAQGNLSEARQLYDVAERIAEPIVKADPGNADWQRDL